MCTLTVAVNTYSKRNRVFFKKLSRGLQNQTDMNYNLLIVADGDDSFINELKGIFPNATTIQTLGKNLSQSRNVALKSSQDEVVAFIDDDAFPDKNWVLNIKKKFTNPKVVGLGGLILPESANNLIIPVELFWIYGCTFYNNLKTKRVIRNPIGCNMAVRREAALYVKGFDEALGRTFNILLSGEEADLFFRITKNFNDTLIIYDPAVIVYHHVSCNRINPIYFIKRSFFEGLSKWYLQYKNRKENCEGNDKKAITTEFSYLSDLLTKAFPKYLKLLFQFKHFKKAVNYILSTIVCITSVGVGYLLAPFVLRR
ncbi:MAG: glycosyltransferase family 2 protein [Promethearchaeota archaeon]